VKVCIDDSGVCADDNIVTDGDAADHTDGPSCHAKVVTDFQDRARLPGTQDYWMVGP
jgi:hypothetical protein